MGSEILKKRSRDPGHAPFMDGRSSES